MPGKTSISGDSEGLRDDILPGCMHPFTARSTMLWSRHHVSSWIIILRSPPCLISSCRSKRSDSDGALPLYTVRVIREEKQSRHELPYLDPVDCLALRYFNRLDRSNRAQPACMSILAFSKLQDSAIPPTYPKYRDYRCRARQGLPLLRPRTCQQKRTA